MPSDAPWTAPAPDLLVLADELCELLSGAGQSTGQPTQPEHLQQLCELIQAAGDRLPVVLAEVQRRGLLGRLLPPADVGAGSVLLELILAQASEARLVGELAAALLLRQTAGDRAYLEPLIVHSQAAGLLPAVFTALIDGGLYELLRALLCSDGVRDSAALRALCQARPSYDSRTLNGPARAALAQRNRADGTEPYEVLIVPGYTPVSSPSPVHLRDLLPARQRVELAAQDVLDRKAGYVLLSGGSVHPAGTPYNEALMMREYLLEQGVSPSRILVDPHARHTTTNLRNAGRYMLELGLSRGLIVTGFESEVFSQAFYLGYPNLSTFLLRSQAELGYEVGELTDVDDHHIAFTPNPACPTPTYHDPLDY